MYLSVIKLEVQADKGKRTLFHSTKTHPPDQNGLGQGAGCCLVGAVEGLRFAGWMGY